MRGVAVSVGMITLLAGCLSPQQDTALSALNKDRRANGRGTLVPNGVLQAKAQAWAEQIARDGYLHHSVLTNNVPSCWRGLGENVGYGGSIDEIEVAYMHSPPHRRNILNGTYTAAGIGVAQNGGRVYTVQVFMSGC